MTRPALRPLAAATVAVVAGAVGAAPATAAAGKSPAPAGVTPHKRAPRPQALGPPAVLPAQVGATTAREPGAPQTGLVARTVVVAGGGVDGEPPGDHGSAGRSADVPARARAPPR
jgi:hypothetical protein